MSVFIQILPTHIQVFFWGCFIYKLAVGYLKPVLIGIHFQVAVRFPCQHAKGCLTWVEVNYQILGRDGSKWRFKLKRRYWVAEVGFEERKSFHWAHILIQSGWAFLHSFFWNLTPHSQVFNNPVCSTLKIYPKSNHFLPSSSYHHPSLYCHSLFNSPFLFSPLLLPTVYSS